MGREFNTDAAQDLTLHDYQWFAVQNLYGYISDGERRLALVAPTGSGKSLIVSTLLCQSLLHSKTLRCAVVVTPQIQIEGSFTTHEGFVHVPESEHDGAASFIGPFDPANLWHVLRESDENPRQVFKGHLRGKPVRPALVTSHQGLVLWKRSLPKDLTGCLLVIDEGHHASVERANHLSHVTQMWFDRGGIVLQVSATPYRADGCPVLHDDAVVHSYSLVEHALSGFAPSDLEVRREIFHYAAERLSDIRGDTTTERENRSGSSYGQVVKLWQKDGKPKSIIVVPQLGADRWRRRMLRELRKADPSVRIFDAVGSGKTKQRALINLLRSERRIGHYDDSEVDVVIACKRFDEGTDWPLASHVYNVGLPQSMSLIIQRWGRSFRNKRNIEGYPERHVNRASITFFIPRIEGNVLDAFERDHHHDHAFLTATFLADYQTGQVYAARTDILSKRIPLTTPKRRLLVDRVRQQLILNDKERAHAKLDLALVKQNIEGTPTVGEVYERVSAMRSKWGDKRFFAVCVVAADEFSTNPDFVKVWEPALTACVEKLTGRRRPQPQARNHQVIRTELMDAFREVTSQYRHLTAPDNSDVLRIYSEMTGQTAQEVSRKLNERIEKPNLTPQVIREGARQWMHANPPPGVDPDDYKAAVDAYFAKLEDDSMEEAS